MVKGKVNLALVLIVMLGLAACASKGQKRIESDVPDGILDISGVYEVEEVAYSKELASGDRPRFFGTNPELEFAISQKGDKIRGVFSGDRDGTLVKGKIDDEEVTYEFTLEAKGGELKEGNGTWIVQEDGSLKGDFNIRDARLGIVRGKWILIKIE